MLLGDFVPFWESSPRCCFFLWTATSFVGVGSVPGSSAAAHLVGVVGLLVVGVAAVHRRVSGGYGCGKKKRRRNGAIKLKRLVSK